MSSLIHISTAFIEENTDFAELVESLRIGFGNRDVLAPQRHHHDFPNPKTQLDSTLLLMPAWNPHEDAGVKIVTVNPGNVSFDLPSIHGSYIYMDATTGQVKAIMDAKSLTTKRTAAASALASSYLSKLDASSLLMIGTGALAPNLIKAHAAIRPIETVYVWGRNLEKSKKIKEILLDQTFEVTIVTDLRDVVSEVDIISCATLSAEPLIFGKSLRSGQHVDLVGSFKPNMRETDDEVMIRSSIFVDYYQGGLRETGDIMIPLKKGLIEEKDLRADLFDLCSNVHKGRESEDEITVFKSVGHALEDLVAARYYFKKWNDE